MTPSRKSLSWRRFNGFAVRFLIKGIFLLCHVEMVIQIPHDVDAEKIKVLSATEVECVKVLQREGKWLHIWRIVGRWANISIFNVRDGTELHEILSSLPLYPYMTIRVIPICPHPASIEDEIE